MKDQNSRFIRRAKRQLCERLGLNPRILSRTLRGIRRCSAEEARAWESEARRVPGLESLTRLDFLYPEESTHPIVLRTRGVVMPIATPAQPDEANRAAVRAALAEKELLIDDDNPTP